MTKILLTLLSIICFASCSYESKENSKKDLMYFDIPGYFKKEAERLATTNRPIDKRVWIDGKAEHRSLKIIHWEKEFSAFIEADINKGSWRGAFQRDNQNKPSSSAVDSTIIYTSHSDKIPVKLIEILKKGNKIAALRIFIHHSNDLYTSTDSLTYIPDSLYEIKKTQDIKLVGKKVIKVVGKF